MMLINKLTVAIFLLFGTFGYVAGQTPEGGIKPSVITGEVLNVGDNKIVVKAKSGSVDVLLSDTTEFKKVSPENPSLSSAALSSAREIGIGDRLMITGIPSADGNSIPARSIYLMTKSDIAQKTAKDGERWRTRGIGGKVTSVNLTTAQITVQTTGLAGTKAVVLTPKDNAKFLRYAPDSIRFDEAKQSSITDVRQGDMIRAVGDKSVDGMSFAAEEIISGAFQTIAGTVVSVDGEKNEVLIKELQTKKEVTILLAGASLLKKFPAEIAERMAGNQMAGAGGARPVGQGQPQASGGQEQAPGRGGFGGQRAGGIDDMLDRFPNITAADLKPGDMIAISSTKNGNTDRIKVIKLLAGVEPFLRMTQSSKGGQRGQGVEGGLTIPGLDGTSFP